MANKRALLGGTQIKVENVSGFDKSRFHAFTAPLGAIVPMCKQLLLPGKFNLRVKLSAQLPPLATDAFLRTHLKVEAFLVPMRLCYGGFQSWFSGEPIADNSSASATTTLTQAKLPYLRFFATDPSQIVQSRLTAVFGAHSLSDYFGVKFPCVNGVPDPTRWPANGGTSIDVNLNLFPYIAYQLVYHHYYRNKLIQRPLFAPPAASSTITDAAYLPYVNFTSRRPFAYRLDAVSSGVGLLNGTLLTLRQRNYGFDYFTTALPSAQDGSPMTVSTSGNTFSIAALRSANALQHFAEVNQVAGPDYVQVCRARYGKAPSAAVASKPIPLGSADFPMYTSGVEQTSGTNQASTGNPFAGIGARYGRGHAEGSDFVCSCDVDEPSYLIVNCSLVPEANYASGIQHDMQIFTNEGSIVDLPNAQLELAGMDEVLSREMYFTPGGQWSAAFGYQPRYMWHKAGAQNMISGLFRKGCSLEAFIPQRDFDSQQAPPVQISSAFLEVGRGDLDNITAVAGAISQYGVLIDSSIELFVSEPLGEGSLPSLANPAEEHGRSVYLTRGASNFNG